MAPDSLRPVWRTDPDDRWGMEKGKGGAVMIKVIVVDDERFVRMGIVGETDWASLGCEVVGEAAGSSVHPLRTVRRGSS